MDGAVGKRSGSTQPDFQLPKRRATIILAWRFRPKGAHCENRESKKDKINLFG